MKSILADSEVSHCLLAADAYLKQAKVRRRSGSHEDVLCCVFSIARDFFFFKIFECYLIWENPATLLT